MKAALHEGRRLARYRKLDGARGRGSMDLRLRADEERLQQPSSRTSIAARMASGEQGWTIAALNDGRTRACAMMLS